jgi:hypothetical protein
VIGEPLPGRTNVNVLVSHIAYRATIWMRTASGAQNVKRRPVAAI